MTRSYYNEHDKYAAQWLRNLIDAGHIAPGDVDERSIVDVRPDDLRGYTQCHFFAGIGGWSLALRLAGWADDRPVWTGSCPCQPFSAAGKRKGTADSRHLWPEFRRLIAECAPAVVFGEQVASADGRVWLAGVRTDMEAMAYAVGAADLCSAGVGSPNIRQRLWWLADAGGARLEGHRGRAAERREGDGLLHAGAGRSDGGLADSGHDERSPRPEGRQQQPGASVEQGVGSDSAFNRLADAGAPGRRALQRPGETDWRPEIEPDRHGDAERLGDAESVCRRLSAGQDGQEDTQPFGASAACGMEYAASDGGQQRRTEPGERGAIGGCRQDAPWATYDIVHCTDGKARRFEPGSFPLAHGVSNRVGRLRAYGNAINPYVAAEFIRASVGDALT